MRSQPPPFITGLLAAKKVLLQLKEKKTQRRTQVQEQSTPKRSSPKPDGSSSLKSKGSKSCEVNQVEPVPEESLMKVLKGKINSIGEQLYGCYCQNETYELMLRHLAVYYSQNKKTVELSDKLKKRSFELNQQIKEYQDKIKDNYETINNHQKQIHKLKQLTAQELTEHLNVLSSLQQTDILDSLPSTNLEGRETQLQEGGEKGGELVLRYRELGGLVAKKPVRKLVSEQDEIKKSFYQSELYSL